MKFIKRGENFTRPETYLESRNYTLAPEENFPPHTDLGHFDDGVCAQYIQVKLELSQSTVSHYLSLMEKADLVIPTRHGKWTYYRRNEKKIKAYISYLKANL